MITRKLTNLERLTEIQCVNQPTTEEWINFSDEVIEIQSGRDFLYVVPSYDQIEETVELEVVAETAFWKRFRIR
jgi:hypothetical protein